MAIAEQFAGLQMDKLIGAPLTAAADASIQLANSTADFINRVGFEKDGKIRNVAFGYQKRSVNEDGTSNLDEMKVDVPMLAIVPIPNLQVDEVNVLFDMEVKQSEKDESSMDLGASLTGSAGILGVKVSVTGSVSAHNSHTRSSDNSAKYHVDVRATNHGTPEGLARVLDMMAANVAPALIGTTIKAGDGKELSAAAKAKAERLKTLRGEIMLEEKKLSAAQEGVDNGVTMLKDLAMAQLSIYHDMIAKKMNAEIADKDALAEKMHKVDQTWNDFSSRVGKLVELAAENGDNADKVSPTFGLKAFDQADAVADYSDKESKYSSILGAQKRAFEAQKLLSTAKKGLFEKKADYNSLISGIETKKS